MGIEFSVKVNNVQKVLETKRDAVERILEAVGLHLEGEAKENMNKPMPHKTPPSPRPYIDTGRLRNSITHAVDMNEPAVYVGTNVEYAPYIHFGTKHIQKNEFIKDAFLQNEKQIREYIEDGLKNA